MPTSYERSATFSEWLAVATPQGGVKKAPRLKGRGRGNCDVPRGENAAGEKNN